MPRMKQSKPSSVTALDLLRIRMLTFSFLLRQSRQYSVLFTRCGDLYRIIIKLMGDEALWHLRIFNDITSYCYYDFDDE